MPDTSREIVTPRGPALVDLTPASGRPKSLLVLGHGAGGGVNAPDLVALRDAAHDAGMIVARVTQPYRVAGRRAPAPATQLDEAWTAVVRALVADHPKARLVMGGRSSGARVACRTAVDLGAAAIICLAFPLHPPGRPERSRQEELPAEVPTLVLNGDRDPFGIPVGGPDILIEVRPGEGHDLRRDPKGTARIAVDWLRERGLAR
ncbi:alpha/beta hydrolase [Phytohabitans flavus]|uniref:Alpha/beta hydrolase n=1 Tax=Phytohabitans flavus TaxID=1076124 RepID=A0A6F8Y6C5_9ACTN|nr:alpha/beta family hydrolase [Phytohabitans flavus]BCB81645.1 alpha/beta hydrolase [Phytohabitans flavus]